MILVTGATGLVGTHLLYHLSLENNTVLAMYRSENKKEKVKKVFSFYTTTPEVNLAKIKWVCADITDVTSLDPIFTKYSISSVYHCAAVVSFNPNEYRTMREVNIVGTANIVNYCIDFKIKKLCHVSSIATLGESIGQLAISEKNEWNKDIFHSEYAITKNGAELEVWRGSQENLNVVIVNPGIILGSGFTDGSNKLFTEIKKGLRFYTKGSSGFVGVLDVVRAMSLLMKSDITNQRFVLVSENKSYRSVLFEIAKNFNVNKPSIPVGKLGISLFWRLSTIIAFITKKDPLMSKSTGKSSNKNEKYTSKKLEAYFKDFKFEPINSVIARVCKNY